MVIARRLRQLGTAFQLGVCLLVPLVCREASADNISVSDLARVLRGVRLVEPRFSGGFDYAPCVAYEAKDRLIPMAQCSELPDPGTVMGDNLQRLEKRVHDAAINPKSPTRLHTAAVADAITREGVQTLDQSIRILEGLTRLERNNASLTNDLAATYFLRASRLDRPIDLVKALDFIEQALVQSPKLPEARFNRALILDRMTIELLAREAWAAAAEVEKNEEWRREAVRGLANSRRPRNSQLWDVRLTSLASTPGKIRQQLCLEIAQLDRQATREYVLQRAIKAWATSFLLGNNRQAQQDLSIAQDLGSALSRVSASNEAYEATEAITLCSKRVRPNRCLTSLARGHLRLADGWLALERFDIERAERNFSLAKNEMQAGESPARLWAIVELSGIKAYKGDTYLANLFLSDALRAGLVTSISPLRARIHWILGWIAVKQGLFGPAISEYQKALYIYTALGEKENCGVIHNLLSQTLAFISEQRLSWPHRYRAAVDLAESKSALRVHNILWESAEAARQIGLMHAALDFSREDVSKLKPHHGLIYSEALLFRSKALRSLRRWSESNRDLIAAQHALLVAQPSPNREKLKIDILLERGKALTGALPDQALILTQQAQTYYQVRGHVPELVDTRLNIGKMLQARGDYASAAISLKSARMDILKSRQSLTSSSYAKLYSQVATHLSDMLIFIGLLSSKASDDLFQLVEASNLENLAHLGSRAPETQETLTPAEVRARLPSNCAVLEYRLLERQLLIWTLTRSSASFTVREISHADLLNLVASFRKLTLEGNNGTRLASLGQEVGRILIPADLIESGGITKLVFVPDKQLWSVPFAVLRIGRGEALLIDRFEVSLTPSSSRWVRASSQRRPRSLICGTALVIGNPAQSLGKEGSGRNLPGAELEATSIAALYAGSALRTRDTATKAFFLSAMDKYSTIHVASHATSPDFEGALSSLALAPNHKLNGTGGIITADEIEIGRAKCEELVVLAVCDGLGVSENSITQQFGLVHAFLQRGVRTVVSTLWPVNDGNSIRLMVSFHRNVVKMHDSARALRESQLEMRRMRRRSDAGSWNWAAFAVIEGSRIGS